jgi:hypothetical protein
MKKLDIQDVVQYVEENIGLFHESRINSLNTLRLVNILKRKNPYLFRTKHLLTADEIVRGLVDAHISSNEETLFGDWLEGLAIFINGKVYGGWKSGIVGIDLEFDGDDKRYIVNIKSGPNWGNSSQLKKMTADFKTATRTLRTSNSNLNVVAVNGCCYGKDNRPDKGDYLKLCGQSFWQFISGDEQLYTKLIEPLGFNAKQKNEHFLDAYSQMINKFVREFSNDFCLENGQIDWGRLIMLNSGQSSSK